MIRAIALDDEPPALRVLTHFCSQIQAIDLQKTFLRPDEALDHLHQSPTDLLFLDINMPSVSGIDFHKAIPEQIMVIFTTAYAEYAVEGFTLNAVDYLLKPFTFERFQQAVHKANEYHQFRNQTEPAKEAYLYIRADYTLHKIALSDILFIEGLDDYLKIHIRSTTRPIVARMTMKTMLQKLQEADKGNERFIRVHRSYIVAFSRIEQVRNRIITLAGEEIPIGLSYETEFFKRFQR
ncbi:LytTR family DNA-binding domain-containing protein [Larkinella knui]|uniref:DNA-binding response regulator n=1 Tax=Larkinella knui TaxID=2025310 RepID=A0A3P1CV95_9BACT|nr:LytTR family DNA-binding domain-containing protein [Larkinella knui]RRB17201.1 DNA-binding response regulator [Larkinella knui]